MKKLSSRGRNSHQLCHFLPTANLSEGIFIYAGRDAGYNMYFFMSSSNLLSFPFTLHIVSAWNKKDLTIAVALVFPSPAAVLRYINTVYF